MVIMWKTVVIQMSEVGMKVKEPRKKGKNTPILLSLIKRVHVFFCFWYTPPIVGGLWVTIQYTCKECQISSDACVPKEKCIQVLIMYLNCVPLYVQHFSNGQGLFFV